MPSSTAASATPELAFTGASGIGTKATIAVVLIAVGGLLTLTYFVLSRNNDERRH